MTTQFGPLTLPATGTDDPVGDPLLRILLTFMRDVVNADAALAWQAVFSGDTCAVAHIFGHDPKPENFSSKKTPALYAWRGGGKLRGQFSQGYIADDAMIHVLWVPPPATQNNARIRQAFPNIIRKSLLAAFAQGRHPGWKVPGDTYFNPQTYGSVLLKQANCSQLRLGMIEDYELNIDGVDGSHARTSYECLHITVEALELGSPDPTRFAKPLTSMQTTLRIGSDVDDLLTAMEAHFDIAIDSVSPNTGDSAGGTLVTLTGKQFTGAESVLFGNALATDVTFIDESTLTVIAPAGAGTVDVTVQSPSYTATLAAAFTYV